MKSAECLLTCCLLHQIYMSECMKMCDETSQSQHIEIEQIQQREEHKTITEQTLSNATHSLLSFRTLHILLHIFAFPRHFGYRNQKQRKTK